jgi:hypothetical protein
LCRTYKQQASPKYLSFQIFNDFSVSVATGIITSKSMQS